MNRKVVVASGVVVLGLVLAVAYFLFPAQKAAQSSPVPQDTSKSLVRAHSPVYGNVDAKVVIVEFFDPACEACRAFYPFVKMLVNSSFGRVNVVMRYAPFHKGSDEAVRILEAAKAQNLYWPVLEAMLAAQPAWASHTKPQPELIWDYLKETGIDVAKAKADASDPRIGKILEQDLADVVAFKVSRTPSFFVNGKALDDFGPDQLKALVQSEVAKAYGK